MHRVYVKIGVVGAMWGPFGFGAMPRIDETVTIAQTSKLSEVTLFEVQQIGHMGTESTGTARFWEDAPAILQVIEIK